MKNVIRSWKALPTIRKVVVGLATIMASVLVIGSVLWFFVLKPWLGFPYKPVLPNKPHLQKVFDAKREGFERVRTMVNADGSNPFQVRESDAKSFGLPTERIHEYRRQLTSIDRNVTLLVKGDQVVEFEFEGGATALVVGPEWSNGIVYIASEAERHGRVLKKGEEMKLRDGDTSLLPLGNQWFIFHEEL